MSRVGASPNVFMWAFTVIFAASLQLEGCMRLRGRAIEETRAPSVVGRIFIIAPCFAGLWGIGAALFMGDLASPMTLILLLALIGTAAGGVAAFAPAPPAALLFSAACGCPVFCRVLEAGSGPFAYLATYVCVFHFAHEAIALGVYSTAVKRPGPWRCSERIRNVQGFPAVPRPRLFCGKQRSLN